MTFRFRLVPCLAFIASVGISGFWAPAAFAKDTAPISCTIIIDEASGDTLYQDGTCNKQFTPMSTIKLPLAIMGFDADILIDAHTPSWEYKPEFNRSKREQKTTDPTVFLKDSIVWYSREITRKLGERRFGDYIQKFDYGNKDISGDPGKANGLTHSWLMSSLKISPEEQVRFLRRFLRGELPISERAMDMTMASVPHFEAADGWDVQGKTGSGSLRGPDGKAAANRPLGWFVGWAVKDDRRVIFARLKVANRRYENPISFETRDTLIRDLPKLAEKF